MFSQTSYLDLKDLANPLKKKGEFNYLNMNLGLYTRSTIKVAHNTYDIDDNYMFPSTNKGSFYSIYSIDISSATQKGSTNYGWLGSIAIMNAQIDIDSSVKIYNFYDLIGQLGGIYEIMFEFFGIFCFYIAKKMYDYSLVNTMNSHLIQIDHDESCFAHKEDFEPPKHAPLARFETKLFNPIPMKNTKI